MISLPLVATLVVLFLTWIILVFYYRNRNLPPGPWGLPVLGYYPFLPREHYSHFADLAKRYGNVFSFRTVGGKLIVVLNGIEAVKEVFVNRAEEFLGRPEEINLIPWLSEGLGIVQEEGASWREHRRFFLQTAKTFGFGKQESEHLINEEVKTLIGDLKKEAGKSVDLRFHVAYVVNSVTTQILFSKKYEKYGGKYNFEDIANSATNLVELFGDSRNMLVGPIFEYIMMKLPSTKKVRKAREFYRKLSKEMVDEHVKTFDPNNLRDYIDNYLLQARKLDKTGGKHSFTMKRLLAITFNMMMEGTETSGGTICTLLDTATRHPEEQKLAQEEIDSVIGHERLPVWTDRVKLPYLEAFIQELYRQSLAFNISTLYSNFKETTIQGYRIPRRSILCANRWTVNNDPLLYPNPTKFDPKRFIDENGKKKKTEGPYAFGFDFFYQKWQALIILGFLTLLLKRRKRKILIKLERKKDLHWRIFGSDGSFPCHNCSFAELYSATGQ